MKVISSIVLIVFFSSLASARNGNGKTIQQPQQSPICAQTKDLHAKNGKYLKSLCYVNSKKTYESADEFCKAKNMQLFAITTSNQYVAFRSAMKSLFNRNTAIQMWLNGRQDRDGNWYAYGSKRVEVHDDAVPSYSYKRGRTALCFEIDYGYYYTERESNTKLLSFFCEFVTQTATTQKIAPTTTKKIIHTTTAKTVKPTTKPTVTTPKPTTQAPTTTTPAPTTEAITTEAATTVAITTLPPASYCDKTVPLYDVTTGSYIKTACISASSYNFIDALAYCSNSLGSYPLTITTSQVWLAVQQQLFPALNQFGVTASWINGYIQGTSYYVYPEFPQTPIYSEIVIYGTKSNLDIQINRGGSITIASFDALEGIFKVICEYVDSSPPAS